MVDLPAPVCPTSAIVEPAGTANETPCSTSVPPGAYEKCTSSNATSPWICGRSRASGASVSVAFVSSTVKMLSSAAVAARNVW